MDDRADGLNELQNNNSNFFWLYQRISRNKTNE